MNIIAQLEFELAYYHALLPLCTGTSLGMLISFKRGHLDLNGTIHALLAELIEHINLNGLFNGKAILVEKQQWYYLTHTGRGEN